MKRISILVVVLILVATVAGFGQGVGEEGNKVRDGGPRNIVSANVFGPLLGVYAGSYELAIDDNLSAYVSPRYFNWNLGLQRFLPFSEYMTAWSVQGDFGANYYLEGALEELYVGGGPVLGFSRFAFDDGDFVISEVTGLTLGAQAHVGYRFIFDFISIAPQAGIRFTTTMTDVDVAEEWEAFGEPVVLNPARDFGANLQFPIGVNVSIAF